MTLLQYANPVSVALAAASVICFGSAALLALTARDVRTGPPARRSAR